MTGPDRGSWPDGLSWRVFEWATPAGVPPFYWETFSGGVKVNGGVARTDLEARDFARAALSRHRAAYGMAGWPRARVEPYYPV